MTAGVAGAASAATAAVALSSGAIPIGELLRGDNILHNVAVNVDRTKKVLDPVSLIFPQFAFFRLFTDVFKSVDAGSVGSAREYSTDLPNSFKTSVDSIKSDSVNFATTSKQVIERSKDRENQVQVSSSNLIDVLRSGSEVTAKVLSAGISDIISQMFHSSSSLYSILANINHSLLLINHSLSVLVGSSQISNAYKDVSNILSSEQYGALFDIAYVLKVLTDIQKKDADKDDETAVKVAQINAVAEMYKNMSKDFGYKDLLVGILDSLSKMKEKDEAFIEKLTFEKNALNVKDLDGNNVVSVSPRELEAIKNAVIAREKTDINNFELDDDDLDHFDLSSVLQKLDLTKLSDIVKEVQNGS